MPCAILGTNNGYIRNSQYSIDTYANSQLALNGSNGRIFVQMPIPAVAQSAVVSSGGNVPVGAHLYGFTASDYDGGETTQGPTISASATSGNQTITITAPATFPPGAAGLNVYRDGVLLSCTRPAITTPGGTLVDNVQYPCGVSQPNYTTAGQSVVGQNGVSALKLRLGADTLSNAPRGEQNIFLPGALTSTWTGSTWTLDRAITVTRVQAQAKTAPAGCSTNAIVRLTDGSSPVNVTIAAASSDSGAITQNYAAGASITLSVQTAAAGCTTSPADTNVTVQYKMQ